MSAREKSGRPPRAEGRPLNKLLASLPRAEFDRIRPHLRTRTVKARQLFYGLDDPILEVVFPNGGVASVTIVLQDGRMIESATIGREGLLVSRRRSAQAGRAARS